MMPRPSAVPGHASWAPSGRLLALIGRLPRLLRDLDKDMRLLLSLMLIVVLALVAGFATIRQAENRLLKSEAVGAAVHWAEFLQTRLGDLDGILAAGLVSEDDRRTLDFASAAGRVRDYQVIRPDGVVAMSSWSGDFRGAIDQATVLSVIREEHTLGQVIEDTVSGHRLVIGQAFVPLTSGAGRRGALKVDVDMTREAMRYRSLGNAAFFLLSCLLMPPAGACGWLVYRNFRKRREEGQLQRQRGQILEDLAKGAALADVLRRIAAFAEQHHKAGRCTILTLDPSGRHVGEVITSAADPSSGAPAGSPLDSLDPALTAPLRDGESRMEPDPRQGHIWSTPLRATSGVLLGSFSLTCATAGEARAAPLGPPGALAQLAALAVECRQAESALIDMRQRHELILNAAGDGIFGVDSDSRITFANPAAARMLRRTAADLIGKDARTLFKAPTLPHQQSCPIDATLQDGQSRHMEQFSLRRGDGSDFPADLMVTPVLRRASNLRAVVVFHDISAQIRTQRQLLDAKDEAVMASRAKSSFLAHMSHELRTPLNAIIGFSEVIAHEVLGPIDNAQYHEYASDIHSSGEHLLSLINDLLDLSKIEAGKLELFEEPVELPALLQRCIVFVSEPSHAKRLKLVIDVDPGMASVMCDERKLKQVVVNLLSNAVKFTLPDGRITLAARTEASNDLVIEVADNGVGIAPENLAKVMTPFGQIDSALSREHMGTGLGLPLAKELVELHGGTLSLESAPGRGTTVTIRLPGRVGTRAAAAEAPAVLDRSRARA
jgi:PAS domain S-box-containing protein